MKPGQIIKGKFLSGLAMLLALVLALTAVPFKAQAAEITMHVRPGLGGLYKQGLPVELTVLINNKGPAVRGEIRATGDSGGDPHHRQYGMDYTYITGVDIAAGRTRASLVVPGSFAAASPKVKLLVDGREVGSTVVQGAAVQGSLVVLSLGSGPVQGPLTEWLNQRYGTVALKSLAPDELPSSALLLRFVDMLILQPDVAAGLDPGQIQVLREWVALGGTLILSAGAGAEKDGALAGLTPVLVEGRQVVNSVRADVWTGGENPEAAAGDLVAGRVLSRLGDLPLVAQQNVGRGSVVFTALPVHGINLGADNEWEKMLLQGFGPEFQQSNIGANLVSASAYLPQLKMPAVVNLAVLWGVYALLVGPGMYLLLRRLDRRELTWLLVPASALLVAAGLYFTGPLQRLPGPLIQTLATVDLLGNDLAEVNAGVAVVSPRGGDLRISGPGVGTIIQPDYSHVGYGHYGHNQGQEAIISMVGPVQEIYYPRVEYQSLRHATSSAIWQGMPGLEADLKLSEKDRLQGQVRNLTGRDLRDCVLLAGSNVVTLGDLAAGEAAEVDFYLGHEDSLAPGNFKEPAELLFPYPHNRPGHDLYARERQMLTSILQSPYSYKDSYDRPVRATPVSYAAGDLTWQGRIQFIGWSDEPTGLVELKSRSRSVEHSLVMYRQQLELGLPSSGPVYLPAGFVPFTVTGGSGAWETRWGSLVLHRGQVELKYTLAIPEPAKFRLQSISFPDQWWHAGVQLNLQDPRDNSWHPVPSGATGMSASELAPFLTVDGELTVQIDGADRLSAPVRVSGLALEGVMGP
ncbi:MAG: hypothetical protein AB1815_11445 [Bacillota bacterium]